MANLPSEFLLAQDQITIIDNYPYVDSDSISLVYYSRRIIGHRFEFSLTSIELESDRFKEISAKLAEIKNKNLVVSETFPVYCYSQKDQAFTSIVRNKGALSINLTDSSLIKIGDYFKFDGHLKVYQVTKIAGNQIEFAPNLVRNVSLGERLIFNNVPFSFKIVGKPQEYSLKGGKNSFKVEILAVEVY